jgi:hypothetical protein
LLRVAQEFGLEGLVAKRLNSVYESGRRSGAWVKVKLTREQEVVIGGYTMPEGSRKYFGSLLVGYNTPDGLRFAGRVGTGFSEKLLASVDAQLQKLKRPTCPFINLPEKSRGRWGQGITPAGSRNGRSTTSYVSRSFSACEPIKRQTMSFVNKSRDPLPSKVFTRPRNVLPPHIVKLPLHSPMKVGWLARTVELVGSSLDESSTFCWPMSLRVSDQTTKTSTSKTR